jgi:hypothetical protein
VRTTSADADARLTAAPSRTQTRVIVMGRPKGGSKQQQQRLRAAETSVKARSARAKLEGVVEGRRNAAGGARAPVAVARRHGPFNAPVSAWGRHGPVNAVEAALSLAAQDRPPLPLWPNCCAIHLHACNDALLAHESCALTAGDLVTAATAQWLAEIHCVHRFDASWMEFLARNGYDAAVP